MSKPYLRLLAVLVVVSTGGVSRAQQADASREMFGELRLIDEVVVGQEQDTHAFTESKQGVSEVRDVLGKPTRVIPNTNDVGVYVTYRLGKGMGLKANGAYVLQVEYPEDAPRTMFVHNRASETSRGLYTGSTVGDVLRGRYVHSNPESLQYPLSGKHEQFQMLFYLQDKSFSLKVPRDQPIKRDVTPADGVPVIISQWKAKNAPMSEGAAFSRIALYEVVDPSKLKLSINYPPGDLPRRHLFWREEMSDGIVNGDDPGFKNDVDWYAAKANLMQFLGMNTYTIDMLEFGHNQGWDTTPGGPNWMNASKTPKRWENVLKMLKDGGYDFTVLPYYEYAGSVGGNSPGTRKFARPLSDEEAYTHITWSEKAYADVTEPEILEDAKKVLDLTINRWKDVMPFTGAWIRPRPSHMPVSFSDSALKKFSTDVMNGKSVSREQLRQRGEMYEQYIGWWNDQRQKFLVALRDHLRQAGNEDAMILFTADASEPGVGIGGNTVVTDDVAAWQQLASAKSLEINPVAFNTVLEENRYLKALLAPHGTWGKWEWEHSVPSADPANYKETEGVVLSYPFNRMYTVSSPETLDAYRSKAGLGMVRHFCLNENEMEESIGYFVMDVERTGAHMMHAEVTAVANGDPIYIGYLAGHQFNRGFPHYARRFNQAYLSLPALPSEVLNDATSDDEVVVRSIRTEGQGTWLAIANTGMAPKAEVVVKLPAGGNGQVTDAATGKALQAEGGQLKLSMDAAELRSIHIR
ncbi:MAG TPA: hypothetical protein VGN72_11505 [Tepidisphaeraceae bacterium]|jgi:hypothetical protein|nr:hypothetical protein [Tepidisphaeraceae bacterium]